MVTLGVCNHLLGILEGMMDTAVELSRMNPTTDSLMRLSAIMTGCHDAHDAVVEIKSLL